MASRSLDDLTPSVKDKAERWSGACALEGIADLTDKFDTLATETRAFMNYSKGQNKVMWAIGAVVFGLLVKALFFAANHGMTP